MDGGDVLTHFDFLYLRPLRSGESEHLITHRMTKCNSKKFSFPNNAWQLEVRMVSYLYLPNGMCALVESCSNIKGCQSSNLTFSEPTDRVS